MRCKFLFIGILYSLILNFPSFSQVQPPAALTPIPSENQMRWQEMEYYAFVHLSVNTYTDMAWGFGNWCHNRVI